MRGRLLVFGGCAAAAVLLMLLPGCPPREAATATVRVENLSSHDITGFYASPSSSDSWGDSLLDAPMGSGTSRDFTGVPPETAYDFAAAFSNGGLATATGVLFAAGETQVWTLRDGDIEGGDAPELALYVKNDTDCGITGFAARREGSDTDAFSGVALVPGETRKFTGLAPGRYRFRASGGCAPDLWDIGPEPFGLDPDTDAAVAESKLLVFIQTEFGWGFSFMVCEGTGQFRCVD